jgi:hypothetical protein
MGMRYRSATSGIFMRIRFLATVAVVALARVSAASPAGRPRYRWRA